MDLGLIGAIVMLAGWAVWTFAFDAPGWAHIFLTVGVFLLIYRIVVSTSGESKRPPTR